MEGCSRDAQFLDFIPYGREWHVKMDQERKQKKESFSSEEKKLELRLGPPGVEDWSFSNQDKFGESALSFGLKQQHSSPSSSSMFLQFSSTPQRLSFMAKESSLSCKTEVEDFQSSKEKAFSTVSASAKTALPKPSSSSSSHKRYNAFCSLLTAPAPVAGWPPIRSFRKNLACSSSAKQAAESQNANSCNKTAQEKPLENSGKGMFVKINMDGVPIGRKVDLNAYGTYDKFSSAVDELFRGLLAAQRDPSADGNRNQREEDKLLIGSLDGSGEYTLVYEDNEGDRMLVGDVPWHMFVATVKRLRVVKSSEVSALNLGSTRQDKVPLYSAAPK